MPKLFIVFLLLGLFIPKIAYADFPTCTIIAPPVVNPDDRFFNVTVTLTRDYGPNIWYHLLANDVIPNAAFIRQPQAPEQQTSLTFTIPNDANGLSTNAYVFTAHITSDKEGRSLLETCSSNTISVVNATKNETYCWGITPSNSCINYCTERNLGGSGQYATEAECQAALKPLLPTCELDTTKPTVGQPVSVRAGNLSLNQSYKADLMVDGKTVNTSQTGDYIVAGGGKAVIKLTSSLPNGTSFVTNLYDSSNKNVCSLNFTVVSTGVSGGGIACDLGGTNGPGISTAIGCIHTEPKAFVSDLLKFITAFAGGIAFIMMLFGAYQMITSAGNPDTLHAGRDRFTSAVIGLLFIIFAVLLMQIIGFDILRLPGFTK